ncbi:MAG: hypothetical protein LBQ31_09235 [Bacteroidales bacterium]|jgi:hypothetical protein|nr:hypothetical protein [Bacteroidales bacterium]
MSTISWGKPKLEIAPVTNGVIGDYTELPTPVKDSTQLTTEQGEKLEAPLEGGELYDVRHDKNKYTLVFELYRGKTSTKPVEDNDGIIEGEYAIRLTPEDPTNPGFLMPRCSVSVTDTWASNIGYKWQYTFEALKPADGGKMLQPYTEPAPSSK